MAKNMLPYLALDSAGNRTILNDYSLPMAGSKTAIRKEKTMPRIMTNQEVQAHTKKLVARLLGQDASLDDEAVGKIKQFLGDKISAKDHATLCSMLDGEPEAEDDNGEGGLPRAAIDAKIGFDQRYPGLAHIKIDNSGIQPRARGGSYSGAAAKSFADRYPGLQGIKQV